MGWVGLDSVGLGWIQLVVFLTCHAESVISVFSYHCVHERRSRSRTLTRFHAPLDNNHLKLYINEVYHGSFGLYVERFLAALVSSPPMPLHGFSK